MRLRELSSIGKVCVACKSKGAHLRWLSEPSQLCNIHMVVADLRGDWNVDGIAIVALIGWHHI